MSGMNKQQRGSEERLRMAGWILKSLACVGDS